MTDSLPSPRSRRSTRAKEATIYVPDAMHPLAEKYADESFGRVVRPGDMSEEDCLAVADAMVLRVADVREKQLRQAKRLRIIARNGVGYDSIDAKVCRELGVVVTNNPGTNASAVAELALTLSLAILRRVKEIDSRITSGERVPSIKAMSRGLIGATVGIIGMGDIAYEFAKYLVPFQCRLLVFSPTSPSSRWVIPDDRYPTAIPHERFDSLIAMLPHVDLVSVHCPLTPETRGLIGEKELRVMKKTAVLVNTARGGIIKEKALVDALKREQVGGAGLDVFETEPAFGENLGELGKMQNVICLPHIGGGTEQVQLDSCKTAVDIVADFLDGKGARNRVV